MSRKYRVEQKFTTGWGLVSETSFKLSKDEEGSYEVMQEFIHDSHANDWIDN